MLLRLAETLLFPVRWIMDPRVSPLRHLPPAQRFQLMCLLAIMWTLVFCLSAGAWLVYGELVAIHALFALGALITGLTFYGAARNRHGEGLDIEH
ncbi:MAG: hypothetical protein N2423_04780 [Novosphingobium sp.]|nr:hypothetical protein [Novosphingobium sp.]